MFDKDKDISTQDKPAAPQTASSAFTIFIHQRKPKIIEDNPNITTREVFKRLSEEFKNLSQYHKKMYEEEAERRKQQRQDNKFTSGKRISKDDDEPEKAKFQRTKLTLLTNEEGFKIDPSDFPEKYGQAIEGLKKVIEDIKKMNLILNPITRNKALQKFLGNAASISCQFNGLLKAYPYIRDPYLKYTELEYNPDAHIQMLKKLATIYFQQKYQNSNLNINFYEKKPGELLGAAIGLSGKIEGKLNDKELIYYIKAHQHGARQRNNEYWLSVDPKEILIYLILYHCGFGEEVHFFYDQENKDVFFIATKDAGYPKCAKKKKSYRTYKEIKSQIDTQNPSKIDKDYVKGLEEAEMIIRILRITNLISNPSNFGFVETVLKKKLKILDFRIPSKSITYSHSELYRSFLEGCGTQSRCTKSVLFEKVCCHRQKEDRWATGIRVLNRLKEGRGLKTLGFEEAVEVATIKTLEIFKMYEKDTGVQVVTHDLYNYKKCILKNFSVLYEKITQKL